MTDEKIMMGMFERKVLVEELFTAEVITNPVTYQPVIHVKAEMTMEMLQDLGQQTHSALALMFGEAVAHAIKHKEHKETIDP